MYANLEVVIFLATLAFQAGGLRPSDFDGETFLGHARGARENPLIGFAASSETDAVFDGKSYGAGFMLKAVGNDNPLFPRAKDDRYFIRFFRLREDERIRCLDGFYRVTRQSVPELQIDKSLSKIASPGTYVIPFGSGGSCMLHGVGLAPAQGKSPGDIDVTLTWTESSIAGKLLPKASEPAFTATQTVREGGVLSVGGYARIVRKINFGDKKTGLRPYIEIDQVPFTPEQIAEHKLKEKKQAAEMDAAAKDEAKPSASKNDIKDASASSKTDDSRIVFDLETAGGGWGRIVEEGFGYSARLGGLALSTKWHLNVCHWLCQCRSAGRSSDSI